MIITFVIVFSQSSVKYDLISLKTPLFFIQLNGEKLIQDYRTETFQENKMNLQIIAFAKRKKQITGLYFEIMGTLKKLMIGIDEANSISRFTWCFIFWPLWSMKLDVYEAFLRV